MTGPDLLDVKVRVREGDRIVTEYETGAGTSGYGSDIELQRFERLALAVAERVAEQL